MRKFLEFIDWIGSGFSPKTVSDVVAAVENAVVDLNRIASRLYATRKEIDDKLIDLKTKQLTIDSEVARAIRISQKLNELVR